jgi:hypothetical protein
MLGAFVLLALTPAAPAELPPVTVTAERYAYPPQLNIGLNGQPEWFNVDDGNFIEVTVKNTSKEAIYIPYTRRLCERVDVTVTDSNGVEVSKPGRQNGFRKCEDQPKMHTLRPGESFTVILHLEQNWPDDAERRTPGKYKARAVFHCGNVKVAADATFDFEIFN